MQAHHLEGEGELGHIECTVAGALCRHRSRLSSNGVQVGQPGSDGPTDEELLGLVGQPLHPLVEPLHLHRAHAAAGAVLPLGGVTHGGQQQVGEQQLELLLWGERPTHMSSITKDERWWVSDTHTIKSQRRGAGEEPCVGLSSRSGIHSWKF